MKNEVLKQYIEEKEHLKKLKNALENREGIIIRDELNDENLIEIFSSDDNWESILKLLIDSCEKKLCIIKTIILDRLEKGELFDE